MKFKISNPNLIGALLSVVLSVLSILAGEELHWCLLARILLVIGGVLVAFIIGGFVDGTLYDTQLLRKWDKYKEKYNNIVWIAIKENPIDKQDTYGRYFKEQEVSYRVYLRWGNEFTNDQINRLKKLGEISEEEDKYHYMPVEDDLQQIKCWKRFLRAELNPAPISARVS